MQFIRDKGEIGDALKNAWFNLGLISIIGKYKIFATKCSTRRQEHDVNGEIQYTGYHMKTKISSCNACRIEV